MVRFFFQTLNDDSTSDDCEGQELAGMAEAESEALRAIAAILKDEIASGRPHVEVTVQICGEDGNFLSKLHAEARITHFIA
jgi:hypothetical protein